MVRVGVVVGPAVGVIRPLRGIRLGVTVTAGNLDGRDPRTLAIGEEFHRGRASIGISPPVPVPNIDIGRCPRSVFDGGVKEGVNRRDDLAEEVVAVVVDVVVDTERSRDVGVVKRLSRRWGGSEVTLFPERIDDARDDV
jgi:hypothetical protein